MFASSFPSYSLLPSPLAPLSLYHSMDIHEDKEKNLVTAMFELPGMKKEDLNIDDHDGRLTVSGEIKSSEETLTLPKGVKGDDVKASLENGVLTVTFPRSTPETAPNEVTVL
ncbi:hypothetical protein D9758_003857 [Tetrapyrgos nigripes]|uniref:SHSP domain-containing protein n=1 Tax=Tetrapyrgos nigripes TaxID=182062 RepID=A0A8H5LRV6_9AGAR|nr:hypothetical protein D9758_003857 [Tetrapyrgos nigripes]